MPQPWQSLSFLTYDHIFLNNTSVTYILVLSDFITSWKAKIMPISCIYVSVATGMLPGIL